MTDPTVTRPIRVLLVEDNPGDARLILEMLKDVETQLFNLERVDRLETALERLSGVGVDVVLLDLGLPDCSGIETFERAHGEAPSQPIVVISGLDDERIALEAVRSGAQDYLVKGRIEGPLLARVLRYAIERKHSEEVLRASEAHYRAILEHIGDAVFVTDGEGRFVDVNPRACELTGYTREELLRLTSADTYTAADRDLARGRLRNIAAGHVRYFERSLLRKDGSVCTVEVNARPLPDGKLLATLRDVTERKRDEEALRESEERFRQLAENIREAFFVVDLVRQRTIYVSPTWAEIWGRPQHEVYERPLVWLESVHPEDRPRMLAGQQQLTQGEPTIDTFRVLRPDGSVRWVRGRAFPIRNAAGQVYRIAGVSEDITELKLTEQQLLQAQKMEAVGRLAGGVAHDFNNLLTVISSYSQLVSNDLAADDPRRADLDEVMKAATAAAGLTRQLLAFSRQQVLEPRVLDINDIVDTAGKMLKRLIGEDIDLVTRLADDIVAIKADPGQIEQILMNLAVNARDAMPDGGKLTIETDNVELDEAYRHEHPLVQPGSYVMLAMTDTGSGMSEEVREHIFEPFFTTKELGKGTGLGLATVYGIAQQSGGHIWCYSEPGHGTTLKIYFPRVEERPAAAAAPTATPSLRGDETILVAEDADSVRDVARDVLIRYGYRVLLAPDGRAALELANAHLDEIDLLLTDVVMPEVSGRQLAERLRELRPTLKVLFVSGYTDDAIIRHGMLEPGINYLQKPFSPQSLARKVREVLDAD
jgi:two-component system cell cycle sensor histidine kinase/response regulator CckA